MSISVPQDVYDFIVRAQERARQRFAAAYEPCDQDDLAVVSLCLFGKEVVVAIRNFSVYAWDEEKERVGEYMGHLEAEKAAEDGWDVCDAAKVD